MSASLSRILGRLDRILLCVAGFAFYAACWVPLAVNTTYAFAGARDLFQTFVMLVAPVAVVLSNGAGLRRLFALLSIIGFYLAVYGISHGGTGPGDFLGDENDYGMVLVILIPITLYSLFESKRMSPSMMKVLTVGLITGAAVLTNSRGTFLGLLVIALALFVNTKRKVIYLLLLVILVPSALVLAPENYSERITSITKTKEGSARERLDSWGIAWTVYTRTENIIFGVGPKNIRLHMGSALTTRGKNLWGREVHSLYFQLLPDFGTVGAIGFLYLIGLSVFGNRKISKQMGEFFQQSENQKASFLRQMNHSGRELELSDPSNELSQWLRLQRELSSELSFLVGISRAINLSWLALLICGAFISILYYPPIWFLAGVSSAIQGYGRSIAKIAEAHTTAGAPTIAATS